MTPEQSPLEQLIEAELELEHTPNATNRGKELIKLRESLKQQINEALALQQIHLDTERATKGTRCMRCYSKILNYTKIGGCKRSNCCDYNVHFDECEHGDCSCTCHDVYNNYRELLQHIGGTLELLIYPYLIEANTVKNILSIISGIKYANIDLVNIKTSDILYIAQVLKNGNMPENMQLVLGESK